MSNKYYKIQIEYIKNYFFVGCFQIEWQGHAPHKFVSFHALRLSGRCL